jgi:hypothetical protein
VDRDSFQIPFVRRSAGIYRFILDLVDNEFGEDLVSEAVSSSRAPDDDDEIMEGSSPDSELATRNAQRHIIVARRPTKLAPTHREIIDLVYHRSACVLTLKSLKFHSTVNARMSCEQARIVKQLCEGEIDQTYL